MVRQLRKLALGTTLIAMLIASIACQSTSPVKKTRVRSAHSNWIEEHFQTEIVNIGLEKHSPEDIHRHAQQWIENHQELFDSWVEESIKAGSDLNSKF